MYIVSKKVQSEKREVAAKLHSDKSNVRPQDCSPTHKAAQLPSFTNREVAELLRQMKTSVENDVQGGLTAVQRVSRSPIAVESAQADSHRHVAPVILIVALLPPAMSFHFPARNFL